MSLMCDVKLTYYTEGLAPQAADFGRRMRWLQSPPTPASIYLAWPAQKLLMSGPGHNFDHGGPWSQQQLLDSAYVHAVARLQNCSCKPTQPWFASSAQQSVQCTSFALQDSCQLLFWPHLALDVESNEGGLLEELHLALHFLFLHGKNLWGQYPLHDLHTSIYTMRG